MLPTMPMAKTSDKEMTLKQMKATSTRQMVLQ
jgi:hypothetical protein